MITQRFRIEILAGFRRAVCAQFRYRWRDSANRCDFSKKVAFFLKSIFHPAFALNDRRGIDITFTLHRQEFSSRFLADRIILDDHVDFRPYGSGQTNRYLIPLRISLDSGIAELGREVSKIAYGLPNTFHIFAQGCSCEGSIGL